jgi:hypothetical protein
LRTQVIAMNMRRPDGAPGRNRRPARRISDPVRLLQGIFAYAPFGSAGVSGRRPLPADEQGVPRSVRVGAAARIQRPARRDRRAAGLLGLVKRAFAGETVQTPTFWYDPRELQQVHVTEGRRVAISITMLPLFGASGSVEHVALVIKDQTEETLARERAEAEQGGRGEGWRRSAPSRSAGCRPCWTRCRCR